MPYHHGDLPRAVVAAARDLLREAPGEPLSIREAARRVGVSPNAPYRHFPDRDALLRAVAADGYRSVAGRLAGRSGSRGVARAWVALGEAEPALVGLMTAAIPGAAGDAELQAAIGEWLGQVARALEGEVAGDDPAELVGRAVGCWAAVHGLSSLRGAGVLGLIDDWMLPGAVGLARSVAGG